MPANAAKPSTATPARPSPARQTTVSMNDFAASFAAGGDGR